MFESHLSGKWCYSSKNMFSYNMPKNAPCKAEFGVSAATADISCYMLSLLQAIEKKINRCFIQLSISGKRSDA